MTVLPLFSRCAECTRRIPRGSVSVRDADTGKRYHPGCYALFREIEAAQRRLRE